VIQVHSRGIPDGLPGPLPPLPLTLGLQSQKSNALQVDARIPGLVPRQLLSLSSSVYPPRLPPCVRISSLSESHTCHTQLGLSDNQITSIPTWGYDTSIESPRLKYMLNPLVSWECPDSPSSGSPVDPQNPGYKVKSSPLHSKNPLRTPSYGHIRIRSLAISFR
jgi:hypothetical protein